MRALWKRKKEEPVQVPASEKTIGEVRTRIEQVYWLLARLQLKLAKMQAAMDHARSEEFYRSVVKDLEAMREEVRKND